MENLLLWKYFTKFWSIFRSVFFLHDTTWIPLTKCSCLTVENSWWWQVSLKSKSVTCNLLCWQFISGCCLAAGFRMQSLNAVSKFSSLQYQDLLKHSIWPCWRRHQQMCFALELGLLNLELVYLWVIVKDLLELLLGFCLLWRVSVLWGVWEFVVVLMMLLTSSFMSGKYWCSMYLLVAKQLTAALWKSIKKYNL